MNQSDQIKMKPPWDPLASENIKQRTAKSRNKQVNVKMKQNSIELSLPMLFLSSLLIVACDQFQAKLSSAAPSDDHRVAMGQNNSTSTLDQHQQHQPTDEQFDDQSASLVVPRFAPTRPEELVVITSSWQTEVYLPCRILDLNEEQTVSWIRKRDSLVLTIDKLRLIDDTRFQLAQANEDWTLILKQPNPLDAGLYECQVSSVEPKLSQLIELKVVEAKSWIVSNFSSLFLRPSEQLNLTCLIETPTPADFVYWYKNKEPIQFDNSLRPLLADLKESDRLGEHGHGEDQTDDDDDEEEADDEILEVNAQKSSLKKSPTSEVKSPRVNGGARNQLLPGEKINSKRKMSSMWKGPPARAARRRKKQHEPEDNARMVHSSSSLLIKRLQSNDTANYTCLPSNARPSHINVVVVEDGLETQPEKRSLQVTDSASSHKSLAKNLGALAGMAILRTIKLVAAYDFGWPISITSHKFELSQQQQQQMSSTEESILVIWSRLLFSQELHRLLLTCLVAIFHITSMQLHR